MDETWTLSELVIEVEARLKALPEPKNGQVRAVPDERTVRYYATIGLLDRPIAMRGRTALYGRRHLAQVVAIKRLQTMGRSLAEIQALWPLPDFRLMTMSGVQIDTTAERAKAAPARKEFWKREPVATSAPVDAAATTTTPASRAETVAMTAPVELRLELAPEITLSIAMSDDIALSSADVRAIRAAAAPLVAELARRRLTMNDGEEKKS